MAAIIVTGGAGFIGSHIVDRYVRDGHRVTVIDNLTTGRRELVNKKAKFYRADITDAPLINTIFSRERPTVVNHHAAVAEVIKSLRDPLPTFKTNVLGTINLLMAAGETGTVKKFIFSSTGGAIYGEPDKIPANEKTPAIPLSPYGLSKLLGEGVIKFYSRLGKFPYLIFRYPNVYGPRQNPQGEAGVVAIFTEIMKGGERPTIFGAGSKCRDYTSVDDIVQANVIALRRGRNEIINLGWGRKVSDKKVFDEIAKNLDFKKPPLYAPLRPGEVYQIALSAQKAKKILGWQPKIKFEEGVKRYISSFQPL